MNVNIYFVTTAKAPKNKLVGFAYVLECITSKGPATLTKGGTLEDISKVEAELETLLDAAGRTKEGSSLTVYTDSDLIGQALNTWLPKWRENGFKNAKGEDVNPKWQQMAFLLSTRPLLETKININHEYRSWLKSEAEKARENEANRRNERRNSSPSQTGEGQKKTDKD